MLPGVDRDGVFHLRRAEDCEALETALQTATRVAVIGAGWIGLEVTAATRTLGVELTLLERGPNWPSEGELPSLVSACRWNAKLPPSGHSSRANQSR